MPIASIFNYIGVIVLVVLVLILVVSNIHVVQQSRAYVVERLGAYSATWNVGLHLKIPFIERVVKKVSLKEQVADFDPQPVITKDNVTMQIDTVIYFQITDPKLYTYGVEHPMNAIENLTAIAGALSIIHHAVAEVYVLSLYGVLPLIGAVFLVVSIARPTISCTIETGTTVHEMSYEVVVETCYLASPDAAIAMSTLGVTRVGEAFGYSTPLHGEVVVVIERSHLVDTPAEGAVVVDDTRLVALP